MARGMLDGLVTTCVVERVALTAAEGDEKMEEAKWTKADCQYNLTELPVYRNHVLDERAPQPGDTLIWALNEAPPAIGTRVEVTVNALGPGTVVSYFHEYGYLGIAVKLDNPPSWHRRQCPNGMALVYGIEFRVVPEAIDPLKALQAAEKWAAQTQADYHACKCTEEFCRHLEDSSLADIAVDEARKFVAESGGNPWTYEGYWAAVLGANRSADDVVGEFKLDVTDRCGLDQWLATAEVEAWRIGAKSGPVPAEWTVHHSDALNELALVGACRDPYHLTNVIVVEPSTEHCLLDNGETGDAKVTLCCATGLGDHAKEVLYYLQTNGDPVVLTDDAEATRAWLDTLGGDPVDVIEAIRGSSSGPSCNWAVEQIESAMIKGYTLRDDGGSTEEITAWDIDDAREQAREWVADGEWNLDEGPAHIDVRIEKDGEFVECITVHLEQNPPKCVGKHEHDWASPISVVGGISENPGVWGHGGGVTITTCCTRCGSKKVVDTAATDSSGRTCEETRYEARYYLDDEAWQELNEQMYPD